MQYIRNYRCNLNKTAKTRTFKQAVKLLRKAIKAGTEPKTALKLPEIQNLLKFRGQKTPRLSLSLSPLQERKIISNLTNNKAFTYRDALKWIKDKSLQINKLQHTPGYQSGTYLGNSLAGKGESLKNQVDRISKSLKDFQGRFSGPKLREVPLLNKILPSKIYPNVGHSRDMSQQVLSNDFFDSHISRLSRYASKLWRVAKSMTDNNKPLRASQAKNIAEKLEDNIRYLRTQKVDLHKPIAPKPKKIPTLIKAKSKVPFNQASLHPSEEYRYAAKVPQQSMQNYYDGDPEFATKHFQIAHNYLTGVSGNGKPEGVILRYYRNRLHREGLPSVDTPHLATTNQNVRRAVAEGRIPDPHIHNSGLARNRLKDYQITFDNSSGEYKDIIADVLDVTDNKVKPIRLFGPKLNDVQKLLGQKRIVLGR